jgi:hypothetical protein
MEDGVIDVFNVHVTCIVTDFLIIKATRRTNFSNLFWNETLHVSDSFSAIHRSYSLYTQQWCMSYSFVDSFRAGSGWKCSSILILLLESCLQACMTYTTAECTVNNSCGWQRNCPKHVEFHPKINLRN